MIEFWIAAALLGLAAAALTLYLGQRAPAEAPAAQLRQSAYSRALDELDSDRAEGRIDAESYEAARAEAGRRLLSLRETAAAKVALILADSLERPLMFGLAALIPLIALGVYLGVGSPGFPDQPFAARLSQWKALSETAPEKLQAAEFVALLLNAKAKHETDPNFWASLAIAQDASNDYMGGAQSLEKLAALQPNNPDILMALGKDYVRAGDGKISPEAAQAFTQALALDPGRAEAQFFLSQRDAEAGDRAGALNRLTAIIGAYPPGDARHAAIQARIDALQAPGPALSAEAMNGPAPDPRAMVARLAAKLKANPNDRVGWVRLVRAYAVLKDDAGVKAAMAAAKAQFGSDPGFAAELDQARQTGDGGRP